MLAVNLAQNETLPIPVDKTRSGVAVIGTPAVTSATAVFVLEIELFTGLWNSVGVFDAVAQAKADNVTGPSKYAWADIPGAQSARIRRTDATGGNGSVGGDFFLS
jgi:hypothetical protein